MMTVLVYLSIAAYQLDWLWFLTFMDWDPFYRAITPVLTFCFVAIDRALFEIWGMYK